MSETSTNLSLPYMQAAQAQKHVTHNAALERLDLAVQLVVQDFAETLPPLAPDEGQVWAVATGGVNDWTGHDGELAAWSNGGWLFLVPAAGWRAASGTEVRVFDGAAWVAPDLPALQGLPGVGINASYDGTNRLSVSAAATLLTHEGNGHQLKVNKAAAGDTASLLFQTGWSGRAEMGTLGDDAFAVKVSADGSAWSTAFSVDAASNVTSIAELALGAPLGPAQGGTGVANTAAATLSRAGNHALTLTTSAATALTLPVSGTLATLAGTETLSGKTLTAPVINTAITGTAVTQTATDTSAGRVLKVGDYGAGAAAGTVLFGRANILGAVSQAAGVPTGAVVERGSNANGEYVRFADGTQLCWCPVTIASTGTASGAVYRSAATSVTFPAAFSAAPTATASCLATDRWANVSGIGTATCSVVAFQGAFNSAASSVVVLAIGRWF